MRYVTVQLSTPSTAEIPKDIEVEPGPALDVFLAVLVGDAEASAVIDDERSLFAGLFKVHGQMQGKGPIAGGR